MSRRYSLFIKGGKTQILFYSIYFYLVIYIPIFPSITVNLLADRSDLYNMPGCLERGTEASTLNGSLRCPLKTTFDP